MNKRLQLTFILLFISSLAIMSIPVKSQSTGDIIISPDGSVTETPAIVQSGNTYTLTANITEWISVQKSNIVIDGAGYAINNAGIDLTNGVGYSFSNKPLYNVTICNLIIINGDVVTNGGGNHTFYNNFIDWLNLGGSMYNNITHCTLRSISMTYGGSFSTITENNIIDGLASFFASNVTVDRNYWGYYLTRYPNATEIGNTGIGNQPYVIEASTPLIGPDYHPLMKPISIPLTGSLIEFPMPTPSPTDNPDSIGTPNPARTTNPTPTAATTSSPTETPPETTPEPIANTTELPLQPIIAVFTVIIALSASAMLITRRKKT